MTLLLHVQGGEEIAVGKEVFYIGRQSDCDFVIRNPLISKRHCVLFVREDRAFVRDLNSKHGVLVNGERILRERELNEGDLVMIGTQAFRTELRFFATSDSGDVEM